ncbi:ABC-three component system protein [Roseovarius sp. EL26]|uniref:ABC-three component system protein n=1 Tax=Roseovarius sp. EL26 TaxID=2126672 RepID=UPI000EA2AFFC|nr:ABC-three component system protein [Roseovarius sp. EL26]
MAEEAPTLVTPTDSATLCDNPELDIIFVHGLAGDRFGTWTNAAKELWPRLIADTFMTCRVYTCGFKSSRTAGITAGEGTSIMDLGILVADGLICREPSAPKTLFICHSLGGLVVKQMLRKCSDSADSDFNELGRSCVGVAFLATPHQGSKFASTLNTILSNGASKQLSQLTDREEELTSLNEYFRAHVGRKCIAVKSFYETEKTWGVQIVDKVSGNPGVYGSDPIPVEADHIGICKPETSEAPVHKSICKFIRDHLAKKITGADGPTRDEENKSLEGAVAGGEAGSSSNLDLLSDFEIFTQMSEDDRRDLETKLSVADRDYLVRTAKRKKERFHTELRRHIEQPSAVARYAKLMADVESRFNRHVARVIADGGGLSDVDCAIQEYVLDPCIEVHSTSDQAISANVVDGALYYLAGNCHIAWDND